MPTMHEVLTVRTVHDHCPTDRQSLHRLVRRVLGMRIPTRVIVPGHDAPMDYLVHAFFEDHQHAAGGDCVVWASRGGGKTMLGAVATLLDLLFKPGIQVRILGGSLEQSSRMYRYLLDMLAQPRLRGWRVGRPTQRAIRLINGSGVEILSQSHRSVRGTRVHKLRCDEVEEFEPGIWDAAQLVTQSGRCGRRPVRGAVEALSTMHRPFGLMHQLVERSRPHARVFRWCALDVIERCPPQRDCATCPLEPDCRGRAKQANGYMRVDDLVQQRLRSSDDTWAAEMMCHRPRTCDNVYPRFNPAVGGPHVAPKLAPWSAQDHVIAGMDFGLRNPLVMLWARLLPGEGDVTRRVLEVVDEYVATGCTLEQNLDAIALRHRRPLWVGVDPAGRQVSSHTGWSDVDVLRQHGYAVRWQHSRIRDGVERIRRRLDRHTLRIDGRCTQLIESLASYHFDPRRLQRDEPVKDGADHACDALRYLVVNLECAGTPVVCVRWA